VQIISTLSCGYLIDSFSRLEKGRRFGRASCEGEEKLQLHNRHLTGKKTKMATKNLENLRRRRTEFRTTKKLFVQHATTVSS